MNEEQFQNVIRSRNKEIAKLDQALTESTDAISDLEDKVANLEDKVERLQGLISTGSECDCSADWDSCGTDPNTWDKLKRCNDCGQISVR